MFQISYAAAAGATLLVFLLGQLSGFVAAAIIAHGRIADLEMRLTQLEQGARASLFGEPRMTADVD